jgi:hypothetical protein
MALALWLLDDGVLRRWLPGAIARRALAHAPPPPDRLRRTIVIASSGLLSSSAQRRSTKCSVAGRPAAQLDRGYLRPVALTSRHGLFAVMTTTARDRVRRE